MQFLKTLSKLHENTIINKQREAAQLHRHKNQLIESIERLQRNLLQEQEKMGEHISFYPIYLRYLETTNRTIQLLTESLRKTEDGIAKIEDEIHASFSEKKKSDLLWDTHYQNQQIKIQSAMNQQLDEIALQLYDRQQKNNPSNHS